MRKNVAGSSAIEVRKQPPMRERAIRRPQFTWSGRVVPWTVQPVAVAPVLPGETIKSGMLQVRGLTDPVADALTGWWLEHFLFFVRIADMDSGAELLPLVVDPQAGAAPDDPSSTYTYHAGRGVDWCKRALDVVVRSYFRDDEEQPGDYLIGGRYAAQVSGRHWWSTALDDVPDTSEEPDEWSAQFRVYEEMRRKRLTTASYEEWLAQYGVQTPPNLREDREELRRPELLRYVREWQYPSNVVDAASGVTASAVSWVVSERLTRARFFGEPGVVLACCVVRPKVLSSRQLGHAAALLSDAHAWLPPVFEDDPHASIRQIDGSSEGVIDTTETYALDLRKVWLRGDQFLVGSQGGYRVHLPVYGSGSNLKYATEAMVSSVFEDPEAATVRVDGVLQLQVASRVLDRSH